MNSVQWKHDSVHKEYVPTLYPGEDAHNWSIPEGISTDYFRLNSILENKYSREFLKVCAFYNKMFPSLKTTDWGSSYNVPPFTAMDQERTDTGNGTNYNYLKQIVDQITSRLGTISFVPKLISEEQSYEYIVYKDEVERALRKFIRNDSLNIMSTEVFHDAAVLGYSHIIIDPFTGNTIKANDYEIGVYESQYNKGHIKQLLFRDYAFPVADTFTYINAAEFTNDDDKTELLESLTDKHTVEFSMYFDCVCHTMFVTIAGKTLPKFEYPFNHVLMVTFRWDTGFAKQLSSSMFDLLYPIQREINRIAAKKQQFIRNYKGSVPVFNSDVDLSLKQITNGAGEALYIDSTRSTTELMTVINPTPLDPQLDAEIQSHKTTMYELAGIQNASFDMENMRSAAAVVALDQTRDSVFQAQMAGMSTFIKDLLVTYVEYFSKYPDKSSSRRAVDWATMLNLIKNSYIDMQPVHINDPLSDENAVDETIFEYNKLANARIILGIINGNVTYDSIPYYMSPDDITIGVAAMLIKFEALGIDVPMTIHKFLISAYIDAVKKGNAKL